MNGECIVRSITTVCTDTTSQDLKMDTYPYGTRITWGRIVALDSTTKPDLIRVGFLRNGVFFVGYAVKPGQLGNAVVVTLTMPVPGDFVPCARFEGADSGDVLELYAFGCVVLEDQEE